MKELIPVKASREKQKGSISGGEARSLEAGIMVSPPVVRPQATYVISLSASVCKQRLIIHSHGTYED